MAGIFLLLCITELFSKFLLSNYSKLASENQNIFFATRSNWQAAAEGNRLQQWRDGKLFKYHAMQHELQVKPEQ